MKSWFRLSLAVGLVVCSVSIAFAQPGGGGRGGRGGGGFGGGGFGGGGFGGGGSYFNDTFSYNPVRTLYLYQR